MLAPGRYPELFLAPEERTPDSFWISLRYFNLYRVALAGLFFSLSLVYGDALNLELVLAIQRAVGLER